MKRWHRTCIVNIALRGGGIVLLVSGWLAALRLHHIALATPPRDMAGSALLLAAIGFLCLSAGSSLLVVGPGLWEPVEIAERWRRAPDRRPVPRKRSASRGQ